MSRPDMGSRSASSCWVVRQLRRYCAADGFLDPCIFRAFQTVGLAFLFVPNSMLSYSTLPRSLNPDAAALYSMFRNISGSVGIAVITALGTQREQVHRAYMAGHLTPYDQPYQDLLSAHTRTLQAMGRTAHDAHDGAMGLINRTLDQQAAILSYMDLYAWISRWPRSACSPDTVVPPGCGWPAIGALKRVARRTVLPAYVGAAGRAMMAASE